MSAADAELESLLKFLLHTRGFDFTGYKRPSLMRRIQRRMQALDLQRYEDYRDYLEVHQDEFELLFNTVLINVTSFFRDAPAWEVLAREVVPAILERKRPHESVRVWSAGCASGEEAYTIAMVLAEAMGPEEFRDRSKVYATDLDEEALAQARFGVYPARALEPLALELREKYFQPTNDGRFQFRTDLRRALIFGRHDLVQDAPISRLDLLVCRNTLMYFNAETQARVLGKFHFALNGDGRGNGFLFLGRAELMLSHGANFTPVHLKCRIFANVPPRAVRRAPGNAVSRDMGDPDMTLDRLRELALDDSPIARIVVDAEGRLALANQRARALFAISPKDLGRPLSDLEISYRPLELRSLIEQASADRRPLTRAGVERLRRRAAAVLRGGRCAAARRRP